MGLGVAILAVPNHPDRVKAAKVVFSLAALVFAGTLIYWTSLSVLGGMARVTVDLIVSGFIAAGLAAGFRFANRSLPESAFVSESLWLQKKRLAMLVITAILAVTALINGIREPGLTMSAARWVWVCIVILLVATFTMTTVLLIIIASRRSQNLQLTAELARLELALTGEKESTKTLKETVERLEEEKTELGEQNSNLTKDLATAKSERERPDQKRLQIIAKQDREEIQDSVIVKGIQFRNEIEYGKRYIHFVFTIFNQSIYEITIDSELGDGDIIFNGEPLVKKKEIVDNKAQNLPARTLGHFAVRQYLDSGDIDAIRNANDDRRFEIHNLKIKIKGGSDFEGVVDEKRLQFTAVLTKESPFYVNYDGPFLARFDREIGGKIQEIYFQTNLDLINSHSVSDGNYERYYDLFFVMRVYVANHGAPTSIERFRLVVKVNEVPHEGVKQRLTGFNVIRPGVQESLADIEDSNDTTLEHTRNGWVRFVVHGVKRYDEDKPQLGIELDVIDKFGTPCRLTSLPQSDWKADSRTQESYITGTEEWNV